MRRRSIGLPLAIGIVLSVLVVALAVGWQILVVRDLEPVTRGLTGLHWGLIILGSLLSILLILGLVLLCAWLIREVQLNQRQQAFLDAVTHEMKTPLASLRLYVETLGRRDPPPERRRLFLERMDQDVARLEHTVDQVLAAARAEARSRPRQASSIDLAELIGHCVEELRSRHPLPEEAVQLELEGGATVWGDESELTLVFRNLLENAVKYSEPPVEVRVRAAPTGDGRVRVEIADRGLGIEPKELRKIFQRFYRAGRDVQRAAGLGLGLFIVRNLVRRQGGRVVARSEGSGQGSRFEVTLPTSADRLPRGVALPEAGRAH